MWLVIEELLAAIGVAEFRTVLLDATKELVQKYGLGAVKNFFKNVAAQEIKNLTKDEIIALAELELKNATKAGFQDAVFSKSNASKLANIINSGVDFVDQKTKNYLTGRLARMSQKQFAETLAKTMNIPGAFEITAIDHPVFGTMSATAPGKLLSKGRDAARWGLETALFPMNKAQAFTSGYVRGVAGQTTVGAAENLLSMLPRQLLMSPKYRRFYRAMTAEIGLFKSYKLAGVGTAEQAFNSFKMAAKAAKTIGVSETFAIPTIAGNISGRLSVPVFSTFVFTQRDQRKKNIDKFRRSTPPFLKKQGYAYVNSYTRRSGTKVKSYNRRVANV